MTQIHFTLDSNELQELISNSGADQASVLILAKLFNTLMEIQRDEYCQVESYVHVIEDTARARKYYRITDLGKAYYKMLLNEWDNLEKLIQKCITIGGQHE